MSLYEVGWMAVGSSEADEHLVEMTKAEAYDVELVLMARYGRNEISSYWLADALPFPFKTFMKKVLKP